MLQSKFLSNAEGDYFRIKTEKRTRAVVVGFMNAGAAKKQFQASFLKEASGTKIWLNCPENQCFQFGVPGIADSFDALLNWLRDLVEDRGHDNVTLVGDGTGGRAALIAGSLLNRVKVIAFNPELALGEVGTCSEGANLHPWWSDLDHIVQIGRGRRKCTAIYSAWDPSDAHMLSLPVSRSPSLGDVIELPTAGSAVTFLREAGLYPELLSQNADTVNVLRKANVAMPANSAGTQQQYAHFFATSQTAQGGSNGLQASLTMTGTFAQWANPGWQNLRSNIFRRAGDADAAIAAARMALADGNKVRAFCVTYARAVLLGGGAEDASLALDRLEAFNDSKGVAELRDNLRALT